MLTSINQKANEQLTIYDKSSLHRAVTKQHMEQIMLLATSTCYEMWKLTHNCTTQKPNLNVTHALRTSSKTHRKRGLVQNVSSQNGTVRKNVSARVGRDPAPTTHRSRYLNVSHICWKRLENKIRTIAVSFQFSYAKSLVYLFNRLSHACDVGHV